MPPLQKPYRMTPQDEEQVRQSLLAERELIAKFEAETERLRWSLEGAVLGLAAWLLGILASRIWPHLSPLLGW